MMPPDGAEEADEGSHGAGSFASPGHAFFRRRRTSSAEASCMLTVTACKLFSFGGCGLPGAAANLALQFTVAGGIKTVENGEPALARACGLATTTRGAKKCGGN